MLTYDMSKRGHLPLYDYLSRCIREDILQGKLTSGEKLPSRRSLARHLSISQITVDSAYGQLVAEGFLLSREKSGYYVAEIPPFSPARNLPSHMIPKHETSYLDLSANRSNPGNFPFSIWSRLMRRVLSEADSRLLGTLEPQGEQVLREAIATHLLRFRGMAVAPEQIVIGAGTEYLYQLLVQLLGRQSRIAIEDPGHSKIRRIYQANGVQCLPIPLDGDGLQMDCLWQSNATVAHLSPAHHYPTGIVTSTQRRYELLQWAGQEQYIIEDDYDSEFRLSRRMAMPLQSIDAFGRVIYMNTFSKTLAPSIRIGYMVLPAALADRFRKNLGFYACTVSVFEQMTLALFLQEGYFEKHLNRMRSYYQKIRSRAVEAVKQSSLQGELLEERSGLHFLIRLHTNLTDAQIKERARKYGLLLRCLSDYGIHPTDAGTILFNYSALDPALLPGALEQLAAALA